MHKAGVAQHIKVLTDRLSRWVQAVPGSEPAAQLEERLIVTVVQFIEQCATGGVGKRLVNIRHAATIGK